jgi:hypothetical protein
MTGKGPADSPITISVIVNGFDFGDNPVTRRRTSIARVLPKYSLARHEVTPCRLR